VSTYRVRLEGEVAAGGAGLAEAPRFVKPWAEIVSQAQMFDFVACRPAG
jgi:hypothetical protein